MRTLDVSHRPALLALLGPLLLAGCSSSFGSGGGSPPARTYIIEPNGQAVPASDYHGTPPQ